MKKIIGITGGIGSGKTAAAKIIQSFGYPVYYSDDRAKDVVLQYPLKQQITALLGQEAYDAQGNYNRKFVSEKVFEDAALLAKLNGIIHPAVKCDFEQWIDAQNAEFLFKETALLFELNLHKSLYKTILITADDNIRISRVMERDGKTRHQVQLIIKKQMRESQKIRLADVVIYNNSTLECLKEGISKFLLELK